jgi:hypothetical protein
MVTGKPPECVKKKRFLAVSYPHDTVVIEASVIAALMTVTNPEAP